MSRLLLLLAVLPLASLQAQCGTGAGGSLTLISGTHTLDTDTGFVDGNPSPAWDGAAFNFTDVTILSGVVVTASGSQPLILLSLGTVLIEGDLVARGGDGGTGGTGCDDLGGGAGGVGGPGAFDGGGGGGSAPGSGTQNGAPGQGPGAGVGASNIGSDGSGGGGGAGHESSGNPGAIGRPGAGVTPGAGGPAYASLPPLIGGSGGGGGSTEKDGSAGTLVPGDNDGAGGGGGGGAVRIVSLVSLTVTGTIDCAGGDGGDADCFAGGGGGGSGGVIELLSLTMPDTAGGTLSIHGGLGGETDTGASTFQTGGDGAPGRLFVGLTSCTPPCSSTSIPSLEPISVFGDTSLSALDQVTPSCGSSGNDQVWRYVAPCTGTYAVSLCNAMTSFDTTLAVYSLDPCIMPASELACSDNVCGIQSEITGLSFTGGEAYYIVVDGAGAGSYRLDITSSGCPPVPCVLGTIPSVLPVSVSGDTTFTGLDQVSPSCGGDTFDEVWEYTAPCTADYTFSLCNATTTYDSVLEVFDGDPCTGGSTLGCSDNACGTQSEVTVPLLEGSTYYVVVDGAGIATGPYELQVSSLNCPSWTIEAPPCVDVGNSVDIILWANSDTAPQAAAQWNLRYDPAVFTPDLGFGSSGVQYGAGWSGAANEPSPGLLSVALFHLPPYPTGNDLHATVRLVTLGGVAVQDLTGEVLLWGDPGVQPIRQGPFPMIPEIVNVGCTGGPVCLVTGPAAGSVLNNTATMTFATGHPALAPLDLSYAFDAGAGFQPASRVGGGPSTDVGVVPATSLGFDWDVGADIAATTAGVIFRISVDDTLGGISSCTETYDVFVNTPPTCTLTSPAVGATLSGSQTITFDALDPDPDLLTISFAYDAGSGFTPCTRAGGGGSIDIGVTPGSGLTFVWDVTADFAAPAAGVVFRVTVDDLAGGVSSCTETWDVHVNTAPTCAITAPSPGATIAATELMTFDALDVDLDPLTITYEYSVSGGPFLPCSRVGGGAAVDVGVSPAAGLTFDWDLLADFMATTPGVLFRITVDDLAGGVVTCSETYDVFYNRLPTCLIITPGLGSTITGQQLVSFGTDDPDGHLLDITYEFDAGVGFQPASRVGGGASVDLGVQPGTLHDFNWDAPADISGQVMGVVFRITMDDGFGGVSSCSVTVNTNLGACPPPSLCGDCNMDSLRGIIDALTAAQIAAGLISPTPLQFDRCNVTGFLTPSPNAVVDVLDALAMAQFAVGLPVTLACC